MKAQKVISIHDDKVYRIIINHLRMVEVNSSRTATEYEREIREFFKDMRGKDILHLTEEDLIFSPTDIKEYSIHLLQKYSTSSVKRKLYAIKSFYKEFEKNGLNVRPSIFDIKIKQGETNSYGVLSWDEVEKMIELAKEENNGIEKSLLIELAATTAIRLSALLRLTWENFKVKKGVHVITVYDKGKKLDEKPINEDLYNRLRKNLKGHKLFNMTDRTARSTVKNLARKMGIEESRNITFHSLKKAALNEAYNLTKDIMTVAKLANHKSANTTLKFYMEQKKDYASMPSMFLGQELDTSVLEEANKEDLLKAILECGRDIQLQIINKLKGGKQ